jgi:hypothetical protein
MFPFHFKTRRDGSEQIQGLFDKKEIITMAIKGAAGRGGDVETSCEIEIWRRKEIGIRDEGTNFPIHSKEEDWSHGDTKFWRRSLGLSTQKLILGE